MDFVWVICPNCNGKDSSKWPFGPCKICDNTGITTLEKAKEVLDQKKKYAKEHGR